MPKLKSPSKRAAQNRRLAAQPIREGEAVESRMPRASRARIEKPPAGTGLPGRKSPRDLAKGKSGDRPPARRGRPRRATVR